ncbi:peptidoglycan DD-metalloendopeptidase family protein [Rhodanobacter sp. Root179]|uniref:murein hydrolase activator EnvC family protein n=1 Tax=Rhodanobacter sp. Root179 TaxID=1736482 RepID=UPI0012FA646C|nr:peptidoglycan DD-metalloendopeptidase family protein [Rhodanobacter sp. Root179]
MRGGDLQRLVAGSPTGRQLGDNRAMPIRPRVARSFAPRLLGALLAWGVLHSAAIAHPTQGSSTEQAAAKKKLAELQQKMKALAQQQADTAARRDSVNAELARQANALAKAARMVRQTDAELTAKQAQLEQLQQQRGVLNQNLHSQRAAIADLLRATYALGHGSDLRLLLGDEDVARIARALVYSKYFQQDRVQRVQKLMGDLATLQQLESSITAEQQALQAVKAKREQQAAELGQQRAAQQKLAAAADAQYKDQAQKLTALKQNAQSLNNLLDKLQKAIDEAARRAAAERAEAVRKHPGRKPPPPIEVGGAAANIRGNLPWPASGVVNSYGNGVLIKAGGGSDIHAVARGKVIYAGFLRGYGMLLIVNHGNGWMSMYGNNESLLRDVGDQVEAGQVIGTASPPTGINTGVYFELRKNGKPVDPRSWLSQRR